MNKFFYGKLAFTNLRKNERLYIPYFFTAIGMIAMFYIMVSISEDEGISKMQGADYVRIIMFLGTVIIGIFATIFLFYTNSFLMKRRKKEFGLYNILGMEKGHISKIMFYETCFIMVISLVAGLISGILLNKLVILALLRLTRLSVPFGFQLYPRSILTVLILFGCIFFAILLYNLGHIRLSNPLALLQSKNQGEKEPKTRWLITLIGLAALAGGYYIAITTENPLTVLLLFFFAVLLVMLGTYFLFTAGSVALLKLLRKNKTYYYKTKNFTSISGMIYRMKQNAVGLANICILSTAVLVMISATVCLNAGAGDMIKNLYPVDMEVQYGYVDNEDRETIYGLAKAAIESQGQEISGMTEYLSLAVAGIREEDGYAFYDNIDAGMTDYSRLSILHFITAEEYIHVSGNSVTLEDNQVLVKAYYGRKDRESMRLGNKTYRIKSYLTEDETVGLFNQSYIMTGDSYLIVLPDQLNMDEIIAQQKQAYGDGASEYEYHISMDITGNNEEKMACAQAVGDTLSQYGKGYKITVCRAEHTQQMYIMYGGFLFLGIFLGVVFMMATVLIIYYKQISEGYEDKDRFEIMQKVGMSESEVQNSIKSQILKVFFLPLVTAGIHVMAAFPMIKRLLLIFGMTNTMLFLLCTIVTILVFAALYAFVYALTAKAYYKIVKSY